MFNDKDVNGRKQGSTIAKIPACPSPRAGSDSFYLSKKKKLPAQLLNEIVKNFKIK